MLNDNCVTNKCSIYLVPKEVIARGPRAKLAYENALKTGKVKVYRARIMLIGQDRAGKTSLKKSFLGLPFDPEEESTDGIEVDPSKFEVDIGQVKNWKRTDEKLGVPQFASDLAKMVAMKLQEIDDEAEDLFIPDTVHPCALKKQVRVPRSSWRP